jgi:hypothetical protein
MKRIEKFILDAVEAFIWEKEKICEYCDIGVPDYNHEGISEGCALEDSGACPKNVLSDNSKIVAQAIMDLPPVKESRILTRFFEEEGYE